MADLATSRPDVLGDRYELDELIARGGMADVYVGTDRVLGRRVAVKLLRALAPDDAHRARFEAETRTLAGLNHPGLVTVLDAGTEADTPYLVMELVPGTNLADCCTGQRLDPQYVADLGARLADALAYVHEQGVVHRDVKPGNVLLGEDGRVLLTDFGIAKLAGQSAPLTTAGITISTAAYLAPEQVRRGDIGPATDVYSLGLVLLEALTGVRAYPGPPLEAALARINTPPHIPAAVPASWRALLRSMTAVNPADRPTTAEVRSTLQGLADGMGAQPAAAQPTAGLAVEKPETDPAGEVPLGGSPDTQSLSIPAGASEPRGALRSGWDRLTPPGRLLAAALAIVAALLVLLVPQLLATGGEPVSPQPPANTPLEVPTVQPSPTPSEPGGGGGGQGGGKKDKDEGRGRGNGKGRNN